MLVPHRAYYVTVRFEDAKENYPKACYGLHR